MARRVHYMQKEAYNLGYNDGCKDQLFLDTQKALDWWIEKLNSATSVNYTLWEKEFKGYMLNV